MKSEKNSGERSSPLKYEIRAMADDEITLRAETLADVHEIVEVVSMTAQYTGWAIPECPTANHEIVLKKTAPIPVVDFLDIIGRAFGDATATSDSEYKIAEKENDDDDVDIRRHKERIV